MSSISIRILSIYFDSGQLNFNTPVTTRYWLIIFQYIWSFYIYCFLIFNFLFITLSSLTSFILSIITIFLCFLQTLHSLRHIFTWHWMPILLICINWIWCYLISIDILFLKLSNLTILFLISIAFSLINLFFLLFASILFSLFIFSNVSWKRIHRFVFFTPKESIFLLLLNFIFVILFIKDVFFCFR